MEKPAVYRVGNVLRVSPRDLAALAKECDPPVEYTVERRPATPESGNGTADFGRR